ncbi:HEAT repeat containing 1 homolog l(2)k09022 [Glossina fuscipes fuscipes]
MSTSLFEQLQRLKVPEADALLEKRRYASILFDSKEAATKGRRTIYDLGVSGLEELNILNPSFQQFKMTLFNEATLQIERAVERKDVNELLDCNIRKFFCYLSPYFPLRPTHMCLEWLIRRFQVHEYNRNDLMALILPYHETNAFVKVLQTLRLRESDQVWYWLKPSQRAGLPLSKTAILNRAATEKGFLKFVCSSTIDAVKELGHNAHLLQAQLNFYGTVVVGALENCQKVEEWHIITLLPSLIKGLTSKSVDFVSAAYIITARLVARTEITSKLCKFLITKLAAVTFERLQRTAVMLLVWIFDTQRASNPSFPDETLLKLIQENWFTNVLAELANENMDIHCISRILMVQCVKALRNDDAQKENFKEFLERFLNGIKFSDSFAEQMISYFLDSYISSNNTHTTRSLQDSGVIELDSEEDDNDHSVYFKSWYSERLQKWESQYPSAFDKCIKESLSNLGSEETNKRRDAIKMALGYRLQNFDRSACDIYESLYHYNATIRLVAVKTLLKNLKHYRMNSKNCEILKECLLDRMRDDNADIVKTLLTLSTSELLQIIDCFQLVDALVNILYKIQVDPENWQALSTIVVQHLTHGVLVKQYNNNLILFSLMPIFLPTDDRSYDKKALQQIITSDLAQNINWLQKFNISEIEFFDAKSFRRQFLDVIITSIDAKSPNNINLFDLLEGVEKQQETRMQFRNAMQLYHLLILVTACLKQKYTAEESSKIYEQISQYTQRFKMRHLTSAEWNGDNKSRYIPLQLYSDFLLALMEHTDFSNLTKQSWETEEFIELKYFFKVFADISKEAFQTGLQLTEQKQWLRMLKELFDGVFKHPQIKLEFLINFYLYERQEKANQYMDLRVRSLKITQNIIKNSEKFKLIIGNDYIIKIAMALNSQQEIIRWETLNTLEEIQHSTFSLDDNMKHFIKSLLMRREEILMDYEQFPLVMYSLLKSDIGNRKSYVNSNRILNEILKSAENHKELNNLEFSTLILKTLKYIEDEEIFKQFIPLAAKVLEETSMKGSVEILKSPYDTFYGLVIQRFGPHTAENILTGHEPAWLLIETIFKCHNVYLKSNDSLKPVACVFVEGLNERFYEKYPTRFKKQFIELLVSTTAEAENDLLFLTVNKLLKKCTLDCRLLLATLENMYKCSENAETNKRKCTISNLKQIQFNSIYWKKGIVLLELLESIKKLVNSELLIPILFELLNACLLLEEQTSVEYAKQLILSALLNACSKAQENNYDLKKTFEKSIFRVDHVVQCLRMSQNPQTHQNALLLLSSCAELFPQQVLHNIVDVFTFMGSSVVRHDDAFSFHIINVIIVSVIPILVKEKVAVIPVLKIFSDIMLDVPEHRRLPLYTKLLLTLGSEEYLWMFLCVVFEAHVIDEEKQRLIHKKHSNSSNLHSKLMPKRLEIVSDLCQTFSPSVILATCINLMDYLTKLPKDAGGDSSKRKLSLADNTERSLFDVCTHSAKQFRHYKYVIMQFLSSVTNSEEFLRKIALLPSDGTNSMKTLYQNFIIKILSYIPLVHTSLEKSEELAQQKFWKVILHHLHDVLDNTVSLLSSDMFLVVFNGLMQYKLLSVRKKIIEILITKLQQKDEFFANCDGQHFQYLLKPLVMIIKGMLSKEEVKFTDLIFLQQTALIAIKLLSKQFALKHVEDFKAVLSDLTKVIKHRPHLSKIILATTVLTLIEISFNLKAHALAHMPKFMPPVMKILQDQSELVKSQSPDNVCLAIVTGIQKLFEALPLFLGPYIVDVLVSLCVIEAHLTVQKNEKDQRSTNTLQKINAIWSKIATDVPVRILVPSWEKTYKHLVQSKSYDELNVLLKLIKQSIAYNDNQTLAPVQKYLSEMFQEFLKFRVRVEDGSCRHDQVQCIEGNIIDTFVRWTLKLSESAFRPLYHKLYKRVLEEKSDIKASLTFFRLTHKIAEALKSLFVLFAGDFIEDVVRLLIECKSNQKKSKYVKEPLLVELLMALLNTCYQIFLHDSKEFINMQKFGVLMPAIVDQIENQLVLNDELLQQLLMLCIAQLAVNVSSDVMWKQLNYQILLKTQTSAPEVRIFAFNCCVALARRLGDDFTPLLAETMPFIAELIEDENPRVEENTRAAVRELEQILGESLQKYL